MSRIALVGSILFLLAAVFLLGGCGPSGEGPDKSAADAEIEKNLAQLSADDRALAQKQRICPVSGERLGSPSMGKPVKLEVDGRPVFICCAGCEDKLLDEPEKYLPKIEM